MTDTATVQTLTLQPDTNSFARVLGEKQYELTNHLGNVLATITDQKKAINISGTVAYWEPKVVSYSDYYPGGSLMPGRNGNTTGARHGFNGMEKDNEVYGDGNSYDFGARIYDPRIVRWLSVDPLQKDYQSLSPFVYAGNSPVILFDNDGKAIYIKGDQNQLVSDLNAMFGGSVKVTVDDGFLRFEKVGELNDKLAYVYDRMHGMIEDHRLIEVKVTKGVWVDSYDGGSINSDFTSDFGNQEGQTSAAGLFLHFFEEQFHKQAVLGLGQVTSDPNNPLSPHSSYDEAHPIAMAAEYKASGVFRGNVEEEVAPNGVRKTTLELFDKDKNYIGSETVYSTTDRNGDVQVLRIDRSTDQSKVGQKVSLNNAQEVEYFEKAVELLEE